MKPKIVFFLFIFLLVNFALAEDGCYAQKRQNSDLQVGVDVSGILKIHHFDSRPIKPHTLVWSRTAAVDFYDFQEKEIISFFSSPYDNWRLEKAFSDQDDDEIRYFMVDPEEIIVPKKILITEKGFEPIEIKVKTNYPVIWKNQRLATKSLVYGVREIFGMKSGMINPGENFTWQFSEPGIYTYVDAVVLGRVGRIVVQ